MNRRHTCDDTPRSKTQGLDETDDHVLQGSGQGDDGEEDEYI